MALINNAKYTAIKRGITAQFVLGALKSSPYYPMLCTSTTSTSADEAYAMVGAMPGMRQWIGDRQFAQLSSAELFLKNQLFESSIGIRRHDIDDDRLGMLNNVMGELGEEAACHPDELVFEGLNNAETAECWDGQNFYDTDHLWNESGTQSNIVDYQVADLANITPMEINGAVHASMKRMQSFRNDKGKYYIRPRVNPLGNLVCNVPLSMSESAERAFAAEIRSTSGNVQTVIPASGYNLTVPQMDVIQYLGADSGGSDTAMYVHYMGGRIKPLLFQMRSRLRTETKGGDSIEEKDVKFMTEARYGVGYLAWFFSIKVKFFV